MKDDKSKCGAADRRKVAADQDYENQYLTRKFGLAEVQVKALIEQHGYSRKKLEAAARRLSD
jgi:hypothetical protein